jgi:hypothetical protein
MPVEKESEKILQEIKDALQHIKDAHPDWTFVQLRRGLKEQRPIGYAFLLPGEKES